MTEHKVGMKFKLCSWRPTLTRYSFYEVGLLFRRSRLFRRPVMFPHLWRDLFLNLFLWKPFFYLRLYYVELWVNKVRLYWSAWLSTGIYTCCTLTPITNIRVKRWVPNCFDGDLIFALLFLFILLLLWTLVTYVTLYFISFKLN